MPSPKRAAQKEPLDSLRYKILLVDDNLDQCRLVQQRLEHDGFSVIIANNGSEAYSAAQQSDPDLILSDVGMPDMNGLALCRLIKNDRKTCQIPIIMMSGIFNKEEEQLKGFEEGADD